jgi:hypothetical protein
MTGGEPSSFRPRRWACSGMPSTPRPHAEVGGNWDASWDAVWDSRGKVTSRGFVVWMAIPFKSLRFPATKDQEWGIILYRGIHSQK